MDTMMTEKIDLAWYRGATTYLLRLGYAEWLAQGKPVPSGRRYQYGRRYFPSQYHRDLIEDLNRNDEQGFKARKMLSGYASALGV